MALIHSFEKSGNWLFRYRGQIPIILFLAAIPVIYLTPVSSIAPEAATIMTWTAIGLSLLGFIIRAWAIATTPRGTSGRNTKSGQVAESLNTTGIYSMARHPLYLGNYFMWIGIVVYTFNFSFMIIVSLLYWLYYERIMFAEERFLERKFGQDYLDWSLKVPAFIPSMKNYLKGTIPFSVRSVLRREYSGALATVMGFVFVDYLRYFFSTGRIEILQPATTILLVAVLMTIILRSLKHYTKWLDEEDRS